MKKLKLFQKKTRPNANDLAIIGSILPDLEYTGLLPGAHERCMHFFEYLLKHDKAYVPLAVGMISHVLYDKIVEPLYVERMEPEACKILKEFYPHSTHVKWGAHTFVEQAIDAHVLQENPHLPRLLKRAQKNLSAQHIEHIAGHLSRFFGGEKQQLQKSIFMLRNSLTLPDHEAISHLWLRCVFLLSQEHMLNEHAKTPFEKIKAALRFGFSYSRAQVSLRHEKMKLMFTKARETFSDHYVIRKKANTIVQAKLKKIVAKL